ncbi:hypothetical protein C4D60_Mb07t26680 [Musa balbisiana]|uniref:non-specific serine/threonine protein kinase n=1 Tax=Musa balbisiana TaxID=52838 RepID=A0A4S8JJH9_MUSBA|nr:hypothetical protein C4D60_Mb07t26680 [Musa balbisiana]
MRRLSGATFLLYLLTTLSSPSNGADTLTLDHPLADGGEPLISEGGSFALGFFSPNGSDSRYIGIWYHKISVQTVVWVANRQRPVTGSHGNLSVAANGTLVITGENSTVVWSSPSLDLANPVAQLLDDGNFVVKEAAGDPSDPKSFAWQSFDYPTDTLLPGMKLGWNLTTGFNRQLTSWTNASDPAPGEYTFGIDLRGDPQVFEWSGRRAVWRAGPWNGLWLPGVPQMESYNKLSFQFFVDATQVVYVFHMIDVSIVSRLFMNHSGTVQRLVWVDDRKFWNPFWSNPNDLCDTIFPCGPNAICDTSRSPLCGCPQGFQPKNPTNWELRDGSDGCVRKTEVDCRNGTDGFVLVSGAKLPDTSSSTVEWVGTTLDQCRAKCLKNCSCTAYAQANISGSGSGCILWSTNLTDLRVFGSGGQDLYVRAAAADLDSESSHHRIYLTVITVILALFILIMALVGCRVWRRKKRSSRSMSGMATSFTERHNDEGTEAKDLDLPLFDLGTVAYATGNFSMENKLGEGGFGPVYKGKLEDEQDIAVKRLSKTSVQGLDEFMNEVVLIAKLQHRNLVRLLGCCIEGEERMLIYEYMPNGSLDSFVFDKAKGWLLNWPTRYSIIVGIARGLLYLHQDSRLRIIHRDLKASNILLDMHMNPKISDFGMARIFGGDETEVNTKRVVGTYGYMSPEYAMDGIFSVKSDVFSFGVLVLEIISGKKNRGIYDSSRSLNLLGYTWSLWREGKGLDLVDEAIGDSYPRAEVLRCMKVGLLCVQERPEDRPTMSSVLFMLGSDSALLPQPRQPGFVAMRGPLEPDSSTSKQELLSINNVSVTMLEGMSGMAISLTERQNDEGTEAKDLDLPLFDLGTVTDATGNFSIESKLGEGGFGPVYKGKLEDEQDIAVKRLSKTSVQGLDEFMNEVVLIAKLQHRNLVRLLGCCIEGEERMLIYEYMPNGSLDSFLFCDKAKGWLLNWTTRYSIIVGIARGLLYLHQDSRLRIIHRDLKASNILLDMHMNPKISDFGMARIFGGDETETWRLWREGKGLDLVDDAIGDSYPQAEVLRCMKVGLLCVQERPEDRPTMSAVMLMLGSVVSLLPQPRRPGFVATRGPVEPDSSSQQDSFSINNVSVTIYEAR